MASGSLSGTLSPTALSPKASPQATEELFAALADWREGEAKLESDEVVQLGKAKKMKKKAWAKAYGICELASLLR